MTELIGRLIKRWWPVLAARPQNRPLTALTALPRSVMRDVSAAIHLRLTLPRAYWLPAQTHAGENTGTTPTHVLFVELKEAEATGPVHRGAGVDAPPPWPGIGPS